MPVYERLEWVVMGGMAALPAPHLYPHCAPFLYKFSFWISEKILILSKTQKNEWSLYGFFLQVISFLQDKQMNGYFIIFPQTGSKKLIE